MVRGLLWSPAMKIVTGFVLASLAACSTSEGTSSTSLTQAPGNCGSLETHIFGAYQAPAGRATVHIERPGTHAVVVTAHEATTWTITAAPGAELEAIYAVGIRPQTVIAPPGVKVVTESKDEGGPSGCAYGWPQSGPECNTENLIDLVEKRVHEVTSFHACYEAASWVLGDDLLVSGDCSLYEGSAQKDFVKGCDGEDSCGGPVFL